MAVQSWFVRFQADLVARLPRPDWPDPDSIFWEDFHRSLVRHGVVEAVAADAARALMEAPPPFLTDVLPAFLAAVKLVWASADVPAGGTDDREEAQRASRDCADCGGSGLATRWRHATLGRLDAQGRPRSASVTFYCRCVMGRWIKRRHEFAKIAPLADLGDFPRLHGETYRTPPLPGAAPAPSKAGLPADFVPERAPGS